MAERVRIELTGGGPWGFRLQGEGQPLRIAKVRKRSKAHLADIQEGDILQSANGINVQHMSHSEAMETIDNAGDRLVLEIIRVPGGPQPQQPQTAVFNGNMQPNYAQQRTTKTTVKQSFGPGGQTRETRTEETTLHGPYGGPQKTTVRREERTYGAGPVLQQVGNVRSPPSQPQPQFGGGGGGGPLKFKVMDFKGAMQQPQSGPAIVDKRMDDSGAVTLNIAMGGPGEKENVSPQFRPGDPYEQPQQFQQPQFEQPRQFDQPNQFEEPRHFEPPQIRFDQPNQFEQPRQYEPEFDSPQPRPQMWQPGQPQPPQDYHDGQGLEGPPPQVRLWTPEREQEIHSPYYKDPSTCSQDMDSVYDPQSFEPETHDVATPKIMPATPGMKPVPLSKLLQESLDETQSPPDSPRLRKKKIYSDSAFFDDSAQSYPTIEEQIKLARTVANVLTREAEQQRSRGAQMFTKRKERADKWVHGLPEDGEGGGGPFSKQQKPTIIGFQHLMYKSIDPDVQTRAPTWKPTPPPPPPLLPKEVKFSDLDDVPSKPAVITSQELEQIQLRAPKTQHNAVAPEKCFNLAAALHASKGRGGQIFAKRRAKSENWVVDESNVKSPPARPAVENPLTLARAGLKKSRQAPPSKSPWEAALENPGGDIKEAFEHLTENKRHTIGGDVFDSLTRKQEWRDPLRQKMALESKKRDNPNYRDFNRKARGWIGGGQDDEKWSTSSIASEDSGSRKDGSLARSTSLQPEDEPRSTPTFDPRKLQPQFSQGATPRMAFPVGGGDIGATDL